MILKIAYYITAHGYGHAVRSSYLINEINSYIHSEKCTTYSSVEFVILSDIPQPFFTEELTCAFEYRASKFDCGCIQNDALAVDYEQTERCYFDIAEENEKILKEHVEWITDSEIDLIISDVVPFAGYIGHVAHIPTVSVSNFWWSDIYRSFPESKLRTWLVNRVEGEMSYYTHHVFLTPAMHVWDGDQHYLNGVNLLREADNKRDEICEHYGISSSKKLALLYTGNYGMGRVEWEKLEQFSDWHFIGLYPLENTPSNFTQIDKSCCTMQEFSASVDLIISKLGYGTVMESLSSGTPILYMPRPGFAEFEPLEKFLKKYGHCISISEQRFNRMDISFALEKLYKDGKRTLTLSSDSETIARWIVDTVLE